jgi:integrase
MTDEIKVTDKPKKRTSRRRAIPSGMVRRGRVYHADFMKNGRRIRKRLSTDLDAAKDMLNELRSRADRGELELLDNRYPWADLKKDFLAWAKQNIRRWEEYEMDLNKFEEFCRVRCVSLVTPSLIVQFRNWRLGQGVTPRTINRQVGTIRNMLAKGVELFKVIATNALAALERLPEGDPTKDRRALEPEEVEAIFKHSPPELVPVWRLFATTGMRKNELVTLRFDDVDWDDRSITIRASVAKGKAARDVPLDDITYSMLADLHQHAAARPEGWDRDHVFVNRFGRPLRNNLLKKFYAICQRAGIEDARNSGSVDIHALRNTFISLAIDGKANPKAVQLIVGHKKLDMTMQVYCKANDRSKREAINALPFAKASAPGHIVSIDENGPRLSQFSHTCDSGMKPAAIG